MCDLVGVVDIPFHFLRSGSLLTSSTVKQSLPPSHLWKLMLNSQKKGNRQRSRQQTINRKQTAENIR
jgi:hypothetical protein